MKFITLFIIISSLAHADTFEERMQFMQEEMERFLQEQEDNFARFHNDPFFKDMGWNVNGNQLQTSIERTADEVKVIIPLKNKGDEYKIIVRNNMITVQGQTVIEKKNESEQGTSYSKSVSHVSQVFPVPEDAGPEPKDIKKYDDRYEVIFPKQKTQLKKETPSERRPLLKGFESDKTI
ncbi:MAG: hypothetical protein JNM93_13990 [Bacteriovoracaceae bacterium]|nr:hypothetical protein [Bacteriovoracaceae bacterium]